MIEPYRSEVDPPILPLRVHSTGNGVRRVQEWLGLHGLGVVIDGDFGPATERAVVSFQRSAALDVAPGLVDRRTWDALTAPLRVASSVVPAAMFGDAAIAIARSHLRYQAREVGGDNCGPWVRHYCRGQSVAWCQGFASTIWADAGRMVGREPPLGLVLDGIWCLFVPRMVNEARARGAFISGREFPPDRGAARTLPGSMFFLRGGPYGYTHVGLVEAMHADGTMTTIEGNTNDDGSANGYEVARRVRRIASSDFGTV